MPRAWALTVLLLLLFSDAVGVRQPAVRSSVPLPAPAAALAQSLGLPVADRSRIVLDIVRLIFDIPDGVDSKDVDLRARLNALMQSGDPGETAPLPLDPSIWRETILKRDVPDAGLFAAILSDRQTALLYHGLSALDDETLGWLASERGVIERLLERAGTFATGASGLRVKLGRVVVPGGSEADPIWERLVGAPPSRPADFVRRLFSGRKGGLVFLFVTVAHLDEPQRQFALAHNLAPSRRVDHARALAGVFERTLGELRFADRPFARHPVDPALTLSTVMFTPDGRPSGPTEKWLWETVLRGDERTEPKFEEVSADRVPGSLDPAQIDAAWLTSRIHADGAASARRRLHAFLFAQRVFREPDGATRAAMATALRGMLAFPALMLTLERSSVTSPQVLANAAVRASQLTAIGDPARRRESIRLFQSSLGIITRAAVTGGLNRTAAAAGVSSLLALDLSQADAGSRIVNWLRTTLLPAMAGSVVVDSPEAVMLAALAGANNPPASPLVLEWEGRKYRVSPQLAELDRLRRVRTRQRGASLDEVLASRQGVSDRGTGRMEDAASARAVADVLTSILYTAHLGNPDSRLLAADNVALRHDLGLDSGERVRPLAPWRFAVETFGEATGWRLNGSLLGLDVALSRFALRRIDLTTMPPAPRMTSNERQTGAITVALMQPNALTDEARDEIVAALERGRARFAALSADRHEIEQVARDAGLSEWRRESLAWALLNDPASRDSHMSLLELFWLGSPRLRGDGSLDGWGATAFPVTGCLCLEMPRRAPWEFLGGRPSMGLLASRGADVALLIADELSALKLPAPLAPGVLAFAMQDVLDASQPAYFDDWSEFGRAARTISKEQFVDYVAALTAGGPLLPLQTEDRN